MVVKHNQSSYTALQPWGRKWTGSFKRGGKGYFWLDNSD